jgi:putative ribosome biogenesis GTPase RsgA
MLDHPMPDDMMVNGQYCCTLLQDKVRPAIHRKQSELLERDVILLQDNATPHQDHDVKICAMLGQRGVGTSSLLSKPCPM